MTLALSVFSFVPVIKHPNPKKGLDLNGNDIKRRDCLPKDLKEKWEA